MRGVRMGERGRAMFVWEAALLESSARRREVLGVGCLAVAEEPGDEPVVGVGVRGKSSLPCPLPASARHAQGSEDLENWGKCRCHVSIVGPRKGEKKDGSENDVGKRERQSWVARTRCTHLKEGLKEVGKHTKKERETYSPHALPPLLLPPSPPSIEP